MKNSIVDDRGVSLVELIVVISIMAIMLGITSLGMSVMFTRDADYVAVRIDDELSEARMLSMSRAGDYTYVLDIDGTNPRGSEVLIYEGTEALRKVKLDKSVTIEVAGTGIPSSGKVAIKFDKSKGSVTEVGTYGDDDLNAASGIYTIKVTSKRNPSKSKEVTLIATTGRHYTDK